MLMLMLVFWFRQPLKGFPQIPSDIALEFDITLLLQGVRPQSNGAAITLEVGEKVSRKATANPPTFTLVGGIIGAGPFVVETVVPDAPTPQDPYIAQVWHFLSGNFILGPPCREAELSDIVNTTPAISEWQQPTPPTGSHAHRYIFL
ncbi:hypothetical protein CPB85DRAFT_1340969 [Mucidula mucida]|nr:hypothetical protein CPB85DRAFT_1340969 [Mucidula mucida]